jgi:hypothetical protein
VFLQTTFQVASLRVSIDEVVDDDIGEDITATVLKGTSKLHKDVRLSVISF